MCCPAGNDHCSGTVFIFFRADNFDSMLCLDRTNRLPLRFHSQFFCMSCHCFPEIQTGDSRQSRIIIYFICVHNLTALHKFLIQPDCIQFCSCRINSCADSCRTCSQNRQIIYIFHDILPHFLCCFHLSLAYNPFFSNKIVKSISHRGFYAYIFSQKSFPYSDHLCSVCGVSDRNDSRTSEYRWRL